MTGTEPASRSTTPRQPRVRIFTFVKDTVNGRLSTGSRLAPLAREIRRKRAGSAIVEAKGISRFFPGELKDSVSDTVPQTAYDQKWQERFNAIHDQLASIGREYSTLVKKELENRRGEPTSGRSGK